MPMLTGSIIICAFSTKHAKAIEKTQPEDLTRSFTHRPARSGNAEHPLYSSSTCKNLRRRPGSVNKEIVVGQVTVKLRAFGQ